MSTEVLQITMAWERKRKQAEADLRDQLNEAEDTITEMGDKVAKLERDLAAAKHDAEIASDMVKSVTVRKSNLRLLDCLAMPVPYRSTEPARPRNRREMT